MITDLVLFLLVVVGLVKTVEVVLTALVWALHRINSRHATNGAHQR